MTNLNTFLTGLGLSSRETKLLISIFGNETLSLMETPEGRTRLAAFVDRSSIDNAHLQFTRIWNGTQIYSSLEPYGVPAELIYRFFLSCGEDEETALELIESNPYRLVTDFGAPFPAVKEAAKLFHFSDTEKQIEAAVYSALLMAEHGTEDRTSVLADIAGSTCLPLGELIQLTESMLEEVSAEKIFDAVKRLHFRKNILLTKKVLDGEPCLIACRAETARLEFEAADIISKKLALGEIGYNANIYSVIDTAQAALGLYLSDEQASAVYRSLTNRLSVITGGPGTGKTQTEKVLIKAFTKLSGGKVQLVAPTGQAAKRMEDATGYQASTIHSALGILPGEKDPSKADAINADLIIIDESSMLDSQMLYMLLNKIRPEANIVFIGDVDQLPSIAAGNILSELISCVPVSRLTKIFRQSGDAADIAYNAARIKVGSAKMIESSCFSFIEATGSAAIQKAVCDVFAKETAEVGLENVVVLSPLRRKTKTGVNQLNKVLRKTCSDENRYVSFGDMRIYQGDKVLFLKNRFGLSNGSCGFVKSVGADSAECDFSGKKITLSGSQLAWIVPAYAETIHKSQGEEYKVVILVADSCHTATKQMTYTACTRARDKLYVVGEKEAFMTACQRVPKGRYSLLGTLVKEGQAQ